MPTLPRVTDQDSVRSCFKALHPEQFYARQLYLQALLRARISYGDSVCPSVRPSGVSQPGTESSPGEIDRDSWFSPYDSLETLVSNEVIWCRGVRRYQ